jgi:hypothetical protein
MGPETATTDPREPTDSLGEKIGKLVKERGAAWVARELRMSRETILGLAVGRSREGSRALAAQRLLEARLP